MLTEVKAYSTWPSAPTLPLSESGRAETDLIQIRNIEGLEPVKASVNTSPYGSVDGTSYVGSSVLSRNIVLTVHPNPDWNIWTHASLRKLLYLYFMPKKPIRLVFYCDDIDPVEIYGVVEDIAGNQFSSDPEFLISIICPDPYFTAINPIVLTGQSIRPPEFGGGGELTDINYYGSVEAGVHVKLVHGTAPDPTSIGVQIGDSYRDRFTVEATVSTLKYFEMNSVPLQKFVQNVDPGNGVTTNLLSKVKTGSSWPFLLPGENHFGVVTDSGVQDWELRYYERFGGL